MKNFESIVNRLNRRQKAVLMVAVDMLIIAMALYLAIAMRLSSFDLGFFWSNYWITAAGLGAFATAISLAMSIPYMATHGFNNSDILKLTLFGFLIGSTFFFVNSVGYVVVPRSAPLIMTPLLIVGFVGLRVVIGQILYRSRNRSQNGRNVLIYGAGITGVQMARTLAQTGTLRPVAFVDDKPSLRRAIIGTLRVHSPTDIAHLIATKNIQEIIVAIPSASRNRRQEIFRNLSGYDVTLRYLPDLASLLSGGSLAEQLETITSEDLLGRMTHTLDMPEIAHNYSKKNVMVTGAGGSIGSELCMQLAAASVDTLVLYEHSEFALYSIEKRLRAADFSGQIVPVLASILQEKKLASAMREHNISTVLHAAAYKHVPIVEANEVEGARNNALGTHVVARTAAEIGVDRFILISSDKAVRPTNVMGATKRFSELLIQDLQRRHPKTILSMVRFGNVLESSGSVIPLFREQIAKGGPVTVTHPDVIRYFMTLSEAARLVLLAGTFAKGGEVFVLDMGKPVRIAELARNMIKINGLREKTEEDPNGDIEINYVGLRPGEKLYEELLIDDNQIATPHAKIMCAKESFLSPEETDRAFNDLLKSIEYNDSDMIRRLLARVVDGYSYGMEDQTPEFASSAAG